VSRVGADGARIIDIVEFFLKAHGEGVFDGWRKISLNPTTCARPMARAFSLACRCGNGVNRPPRAARGLESYRQSTAAGDDLISRLPRGRAAPASDAFMPSYRCDLLDTKLRITTVEIVECAGDDDAKLRRREICSANDSCRGVEVWDNARRVYCYADEGPQNIERTPGLMGE
jgi:hypothetical protein